MTNSNKIAVTALGVVSSCGFNAEQSCAAITAGCKAFTEHEYYQCQPDDPKWDEPLPLTVSTVPFLNSYEQGVERFLQLTIPALTEVLEKSALKRENLDQCGFFLSLPVVDGATIANGINQNSMEQLCKRLGILNLNVAKINQSGNTAVFENIAAAMTLLQTKQLDYCIVGGVDSWLLDERLDQLDDAMRIQTERNRDGFIPGEAASMVMLERVESARSRGMPILSIISGLGDAIEPENYFSKKNSTGQGLTQAIRTVLSNSNNTGFKKVYCDFNGESGYAFESGVVQVRLNSVFEKLEPIVQPAENCGDIGAATGGLLLACATLDHYSGSYPADDVLLWTCSDNGKRVAISLQQADINQNN